MNSSPRLDLDLNAQPPNHATALPAAFYADPAMPALDRDIAAILARTAVPGLPSYWLMQRRRPVAPPSELPDR